MRKFLIVASIALFPATAMAQQATTPPPATLPSAPSLSESVPLPRTESGIDGYQVAAISAGAIAGVVIANLVTGGLITPVLMAGAGGAGVMAHGAGWMALKTGVTAVGAVAGGYTGNYLYEQQ